MAQTDENVPGLYWQSRMGNNPDGIGGNCHRYAVVTKDATGKLVHGNFVVDYGIKMGTERHGFACEFPSPQGVFARRDTGLVEGGGQAPEALLLTHAHEDHLGAVRHAIDMGYQVPPVYCTAFTAQILAKSLLNGGIAKDDRPPVTVVAAGERVAIAHAEVEFVPVDHLPGSSALRISTADATVFHTGDYKFDHTLPLGDRADPARLLEIGKQGVDLVVADSTAAGDTSTKVYERDIQQTLSKIIADNKGRAIVAGVLGTQLDRLASLARAAAENGRVVVVTGRSLENNVFALRRSGTDIEAVTGACILPAALAKDIPAAQAVVVTTGAFAQSHAGLSRAADRLPGALYIDQGTTAIIPQRAIPPVKTAYNAMVGKLESLGARVITPENAEKMGYGVLHQSGHAIESDAKLLYTLLKPRQLVAPMHGGAAQLENNAKVARSLGIAALPLDHNGAIVRVRHDGAQVVGQDPVGRIGAAEMGGSKQLPRAKKGEDRRDGPVPLYRYENLSDAALAKRRGRTAEADPVRLQRSVGR
jgi:ribonuclease J